METFETKSDDEKKAVESGHSPWRAILIVVHMCVLIVFIAMCNIPGSAFPEGTFLSFAGNVSRRFPNPLTPAHWAFSTWFIVYAWQLIHCGYSLSLLCRRQKDGRYLYTKFGHVHFSFYLLFIVNNVAIICWLFAFDREYFIPAFLIQCVDNCCLWISFIILCFHLNKAGAYFESSGNSKEIWFTRIFLINGVAFYATWSSILLWVNLTLPLIYREGISEAIASWVSLSILCVKMIVWFILETLVYDRYLRYCFSEYIVLVISLVGLLNRNYDVTSPKPYHILALAMTVFAGLLAITKVIIMLVRARRQPIVYTASP